jgi:arsenate reductase
LASKAAFGDHLTWQTKDGKLVFRGFWLDAGIMATTGNVLFLCTGNSARSILAEAILNSLGRGRFCAFSAGSHPKDEVHPSTIALLKRKGYEVDGLRAKSWEEFAAPGGPPFDYVITVCNNAAAEDAPLFSGKAARAHWDIPDPPAAMDVPAAFERAYSMLLAHIGTLLFGGRSRL